jgi:hypothetical protein
MVSSPFVRNGNSGFTNSVLGRDNYQPENYNNRYIPAEDRDVYAGLLGGARDYQDPVQESNN